MKARDYEDAYRGALCVGSALWLRAAPDPDPQYDRYTKDALVSGDFFSQFTEFVTSCSCKKEPHKKEPHIASPASPKPLFPRGAVGPPGTRARPAARAQHDLHLPRCSCSLELDLHRAEASVGA